MRILIIGAGEVGYNLAKRLSLEQKDVVLVDLSETLIKRASETLDLQTVLGNGASPKTLIEGQVTQSDMLIAVTDSDEINMLACLTAELLNPEILTISRIRNNDYSNFEPLIGAKGLRIDRVINPEGEACRSILNIVKTPGVTDSIDFAEGKVKLLGIKIKGKNPLTGKKIGDLWQDLPGIKVLIISIMRGSKLIIPKGDDIIRRDDTVFFVTEPSHINETLSFFNITTAPYKRIMILGAGTLGCYVAEELNKIEIDLKIIEKRGDRCQKIAENLDKAIVLKGDGMDSELLLEENIKDVDLFIALTNDEDLNILASLQAKKLGAKKVIALINRVDLIPLVSTLGIDIAICPRLIAVSTILEYIRKGIVLHITEVRDEMAEALEIIATEGSKIVNKPIREVKLPPGALFGAIERDGKIIIPLGNTIINPGDRVFIFATKKAIKHVEKVLQPG